MPAECSTTFPVQDYDLAATLNSGQAFRWQKLEDDWVGVIGHHWVRLRATPDSIQATTATAVGNWDWLKDYLQLDVNIAEVIRHFPDDEPMRRATSSCRGLRLLRQDPWECLASFILSSTKRIVQIRQIISLVCERFGKPVEVPPCFPPAYAFPSADQLARAGEQELRQCKMGFRAPYLAGTAKAIANGALDLEQLRVLDAEAARQRLMALPGVGRKVADCVLLFAYGFQSAFPVDVWIMKALRQLYFPKRCVNLSRLHHFAASHFGDHAGYAQQYLFHYMRVTGKLPARAADT